METKHVSPTNAQEQIRQLSSEIESLKQKVVESDKLAFIGALSAGIMHEIKNPLNFVNNFARLSFDLIDELKESVYELTDKPDKDSIEDINELTQLLDANLKKILENGERAQRIVFSMLSQTHDSQQAVFQPVDVNQLVDEFAKLGYQGVRGNDKDFNVSIKTNYDPDLGKVNIGIQEISRVIINIVNNACYALNEKKKELKGAFSPEIILSTKRKTDTFEISIRDNGTGIPQSVIDKLYEPFFTTKPKGQGTGLGLSLSYDIITNVHKGKIDISSEKNKYTEFTIEIPLAIS